MDYCTYEEFNADLLTNTKPVKKEPKPKPGEKAIPPYHIVNLQYNFGNDDKPKYFDFKLEFCELFSAQGIMRGNGKDGTQDNRESIKVYFNPEDIEQEKMINVLESMYLRAATLLHGVKGQVNRPKVDIASPESWFKHPIYYPTDPDTSERIPGKHGSMYLKLFSRGSGFNLDETQFFDPSGTPLDKSLLMGVQMRFIPVVLFKSVYVGSSICLQIEMTSAVVTDIRLRNGVPSQVRTLEKMRSLDPDAEARFQEQCTKIKMARQNQFLQAPDLINNTEEITESSSTLEGIKPVAHNVYQQDTNDGDMTLQKMVQSAPKRLYKLPMTSN